MSKTLGNYPQVKYSVTRLGGGQTYNGQSYPGGLDLTTPSLSLQPGALRNALNFECSQSGGYSRIEGYERFDGRAAPSAASYAIVQFQDFTIFPALGHTVTQATTGATGKIVATNTVVGAFYLVLTQVSGTFDTTHAYMISDGATPIGIAFPRTASITSKQSAQYTALASDVYRALIGAVPGSGPIYDVFNLSVAGSDVCFAFRANLGGTAVNLYKSTAGGWSQVVLLNTVAFTAGSALPLEGDTLTQGGVTATIRRVLWNSGTTGETTAAGTLVITNPAGGNFAAGAATSSSGGAFNLVAIQAAITILPGGSWEHAKNNFSGAAGSKRVYGCDGVNKGYEFDGTYYAPIPTGSTPDAPKHVVVHKNYLIFSTAGSVQGSGPGLPYKWTSTDGAWELATGAVVTGMVSLPGQQTTAALAVFTDSNTQILYGTDRSSFNLIQYNTGIGGLARSAQNLFDAFVFDTLGVLTLQTSLNFGNFAGSSLTKNILPFIIQQRTKVSASTINRTKSAYRVFFNDGYGLYLTIVNQQYLGAIPVQFPNAVKCIDEDTLVSGSEITYFGSSDSLGYVYTLDKGPSFDGGNLDAYITLAWDPIKSPRVLKRFRAASLEIQGNAYAEVSFGYSFSYGSQNVGQPQSTLLPTSFSAPLWDSFTWDNFVWDGQTLAPSDVDLSGTSENIQVTISSTTNYIYAFTLNSVIYHYTPRRGIRV